MFDAEMPCIFNTSIFIWMIKYYRLQLQGKTEVFKHQQTYED